MNKLTINKVTLGKRLLEVIKNPIIVIYIILLLIWGVVVILSILNPNPSANKLSAILYITLPILYLFLGLKCAEYYITSVCVEDSTITITYLKFNKEYTLTEKLDDIAIDFGVKSKFSLGAGISIQRKISKYDTKNIFLQSYLLDWNKDENIEALKAIFFKKIRYRFPHSLPYIKYKILLTKEMIYSQ